MKTIVCTLLVIASMVVNVAAQRAASYHEIAGRVLEVHTTHIVVEPGSNALIWSAQVGLNVAGSRLPATP
jgi:hypothetical protein